MSVAPFKPLTKDEVAEILGVSIRTVENYVNDGQMPAPASLGRRVYWHPDLFYAWLDSFLRSQSGAGESEKTVGSATHGAPEVAVTGASKVRQRDIGLPSRSTRQNRTGATAMGNVAARSNALIKQLEQGACL